MLKPFLFVIANFFLIDTAKCQSTDTTITYFKNDLDGYHLVTKLDSADFFRVVLPPDSADNLSNVKEYYKNGKIKFVGKFVPQLSPMFPLNSLRLSGDCISFYPNGKKQSVAHYTDGKKEGNEYIFYPNGSVYCYLKHFIEHGTFNTSAYWECYDSNGTMICSDGAGKWIVYDKTFKNILISGPVKNGLREGEWHGGTGNADSITYLYKYHNGVIVSSIGYDKTGIAYPFKRPAEMANYRGRVLTFIKIFKSHLILPKDQDGRKMSVDTAHISFIVEKDGHLSDFKVLGDVNPDVQNALGNAIGKCHDWQPSIYYGVPLRTRIILPLTFIHGYTGDAKNDYYREEVFFNERIIGF